MPAREFLPRNWHVITMAMTAAAIACAALVMLATPPIGSQDIIPAIDLVLEIYIFILLAVVILGWLISFKVVPSDARGTAPARAFLGRATDPVLRPIRFVLPHARVIDVSPVIMIILIMAMRYALAIYGLPEPIIGSVDNILYVGDRYYVLGWACQRGNRASIDVHIYAGGTAGGKPPGTFLAAGKADLDNEPAVHDECQAANGGKHRFKIELPNQLLRTFQRKSLFAHGSAVVGNVENVAISQSGKFQLPSPK
jgi:uncharacterized protein YggT (Ycf19 family)